MTSESASFPPDDDDALAAEYAVGALSAEERRAVAGRIARDLAFARLVEAWEARLSPLAAGFPSVAPPAAAKLAIDQVLFATPARGAFVGGLWRSLAFWRGAAAVAVLLLAIVVAGPRLIATAPPAGREFVAAIAPQGGDVSYLGYFDAPTSTLSLVHVSGQPGAGHDFELWAIEGKSAPVSLGVIARGRTVRVALRPAIGQALARGGTLAISLEPPGGSPTGQPSGPVVAAGGTHPI